MLRKATQSKIFWILLVVLLFLGIMSVRYVTGERLKTAPQQNKEMKTIGIVGGVSWVSSLEYYRLMNELVQSRLGDLHSAKILMFSIEFNNFAKEERLAEKGNWAPLKNTMVDAAKRLQKGGADFIVIASNTMNSTVDLIQNQVPLPIIHIADSVGSKAKEMKLKKLALLGTKFTMEQPFYKDHLKQKYNLDVAIPSLEEREYINAAIFDELCKGIITKNSKNKFLAIIERLRADEHVDGVLLGCTEIPLLIKQQDIDLPVLDSTALHAEAAVTYALQEL